MADRPSPGADLDERRDDDQEIYKEAGLPTDFVRRFALEEIAGSHALGHQPRMATESRVAENQKR